ncbi:BTAD domain-containing putative transcriptional regulator [Saxibacter everestensis]|uniref:BTAD domain-containing putative transcriptional regulator n=1 Tax=Saxibacter everestensis TaxID=2909229 RepID=A0ABY8QPR0_9MICO|nr:BTAD domain-containing putative transcriptional regulator [Brevibacteriaceae bacterium ZFBP1038]
MLRTDSARQVAVLGPVLVENADGELAEVNGARAKSLIVALGLAQGATVAASELVQVIWPESAPASKAALHTLVSRTRANCAAGLLVTHSSGYQLDVAAASIDLFEAAEADRKARQEIAEGRYSQALILAEAALGWWRGDGIDPQLSPDLADELQRRTDQLRWSLLHAKARCLVELRRFAEAVTLLQTLCSVRLDESLEALLLKSLFGAGRNSEALDRFQQVRRRLRDELGASPSRDLQAVHTSILRGDDSLLGSAAESRPRVLSVGLRAEPNPLLGRADDVDSVEQLMMSSRLTTILGAGGLGKTRLAQEIGRRAVAGGKPATILVELAAIRSVDDVMPALAGALGIREASATSRLATSGPGPDLRIRIVDRLSERRTLLILDNCEHVVSGVARLSADLLASIESLSILATSRAPLSIAAEHIYQLNSLVTGARSSDSPAVQLFRDRADAARPGTSFNDAVIARLCERLDGLPLAIELAAAKVRTMTVEEIERRLDRRFSLLTSGDRSAPERHQTLLAVIEWSWNLLDPAEQKVLRRLSGFPDGFSAEAARTVADFAAGDQDDEGIDVDLALVGLVNQSLINVEERDGAMRYRMLETVREFGDMSLVEHGEDRAVESASLRWAEEFCLAELSRLSGTYQLQTIAAVSLDQENLLANLRIAMRREDAEATLTIFAVLGFFWSLRGAHSEVAGFCAAILDVSRGYLPRDRSITPAVFSLTAIAATGFQISLRTSVRAMIRLRGLLASGLSIEPGTLGMARLAVSLGDAERMSASLAAARADADEGVRGLGNLLSAREAENAGEVDTARRFAAEARRLAERRDDTWSQATSAHLLAELNSQSGRARDAIAWADRAVSGLALVQADDDIRHLRWILAANLISTGRVAEGRAAVLDTFEEVDEDAESGILLVSRCVLAEASLAEGDVATGLAAYRAVLTDLPNRARRKSQWWIYHSAAMVCAHVRHGHGDIVELAGLARRTRITALSMARLRSKHVDKPLVGMLVLSNAVWLLSEQGQQYARNQLGGRDSVQEANSVVIGLELLALSERMAARQDYPALSLPDNFAAAARSYGAARVESYRSSYRTFSGADAARRALELLAGPFFAKIRD